MMRNIDKEIKCEEKNNDNVNCHNFATDNFCLNEANSGIMSTDAMIRSSKKSRAIKRHIIAKVVFSLIFLLIIATFLILKSNVAFCEMIVRNFTFGWTKFFGSIFAILPFSFFEVFCVIMVCVVIALLVVMIILMANHKGKRAFNHLLTICLVALGIFAMYTTTTTVAYNREPLQIAMTDNAAISKEGIEKMAMQFHEDSYAVFKDIQDNYTDSNGASICPYTFKELNEKIRAEYQKLPQGYFPKYVPNAKPMVSSWFMSQFAILGVTFVPFGEGNINKDAPMTEVAHTIAHELAHTVGVMREYEANTLATYILINSDDTYLRYVGYLNIDGTAENMLKYSNNNEKLEELNNICKEKNISVLDKDFEKSYDFWSKNRLFDSIGEFFNNIYLKLQGQKSGTDSYYQGVSGDKTVIDDGTEDGLIVYSNIVYTDIQRMIYAMYSK